MSQKYFYKNIINKRFKYKFFFFNKFDEQKVKSIDVKINILDDYNIYNMYYYIQEILFLKPYVKKYESKIVDGGLRQKYIEIYLNIFKDKYIFNFLKIMYLILKNKNYRKNLNIKSKKNGLKIYLNINEFKDLNYRDNLVLIKPILNLNLKKKNNYNFTFKYFLRLIGLI